MMKKATLLEIFLVPVLLLLGAGRRVEIQKNIFASFRYKTADEKLLYPDLVNRFYLMNGNHLFWFAAGEEKNLLRRELLRIIDSSCYSRLIEKAYHSDELKPVSDNPPSDSLILFKTDRLFTDAAIAVFKDIYQGYRISPWVGYDQLSEKYADADNEYLLRVLLQATVASQLKLFVEALQPLQIEYTTLKKELSRQITLKGRDTIAFLLRSMNYYRWIYHFRFEKFIVVNLPAARLGYYENDSLILDMKTVVGKIKTPTPRFATYCDQAILYPYWYVPPSIIFNEYLPRIKNNPSWLDANNMQVVDGTGRILNHHKLNWASFHAGYFPYMIRQSTGCDNALGVIKFNIIAPYGVYLHDTNNKTAFLSGSRFYSHGCIRLEEPIKLGNYLLAGKLDTTFLQSCFKEQKPIPVLLEKPIPVFVVYMPAVASAKGIIHYYKDIYKLIK